MMSTSRRCCINHPDNFCYICGKYTTHDQRKNLASKVKTAYKYYFGCKVGDQDKSWAPHICLTVCNSGLRKEKECLLLYQWCGVNQQIITPTATFV